LYDLQKDPEELDNLFGKKGYEALTKDLQAQLVQLEIKYDATESR